MLPFAHSSWVRFREQTWVSSSERQGLRQKELNFKQKEYEKTNNIVVNG
jgi:hypothetical protein